MPRLHDIPIRQKLTAIVLIASSVALLVACAVFIIMDRIEMRANAVHDLQILADVVGSNSTAAITFKSEGDASEILTALRAQSHITSACIYTAEGRTFAEYFRKKDAEGTLPPSPPLEGASFGEDNLTLSRKIMLHDKSIGTIYLESDLQEFDARARQYALILTMAFVLSNLVAFFVVSRIQRVISQPISQLTEVARHVSVKRDYSIRASGSGKDEVGFLIQVFNEMLTNIQVRDAALQDAQAGLETRVRERTTELEAEISVRRVAEEAVRRSESKYRTLFDTANDAIFIMDGSTFIDCNRCTLMMFGCQREDIVGQSPYRFSPPYQPGGQDSTEMAMTKIGAVLAGAPQFFEWKHMKLDGTLFDAEVSLERMELEGTSFVMAIVRDITRRKRAERVQAVLKRISEEANGVDSIEQLLLTVHEQLNTMIDATNFCVALYDKENGYYTFPYCADRRAEESNLRSKTAHRLIEQVRETGKALLANEETLGKLDEETGAGVKVPNAVIWLGVPLLVSGEAVGVIAVQHFSDPKAYFDADLALLTSVSEPVSRVLERMQAELHNRSLQEKLERAERMESLGVLAGGVAHDLNNMLGPVVGYSELILREIGKDSKLSKRVAKIGRSAKDAADVIQDLLTLARRGRYEMNPIDFNEVVGSYVDSPAYQKLSESHPNIRVEIQLNRPLPKISGSPPHLSKVVMNLVVNAFDAMSNGGNLTVSTSQRHLSVLIGGHELPEPGDYVMLRVRDSGIGIDSKDLEKIFEPYYSKKKMGTSGSGLGLSVVYGVVKDHKGYYDVISEVGKGTEFILYFPVTSAEAKTTTLAERNMRGNETVLIVDDVLEQREMAAEILSSLGYQTVTADGGSSAVQYLRNHTVDIVVLDMIMEQGFDGLDTFCEIIRINPHQKAIIVSGYSATDRVQEMQRLGAGPYIKKPYSLLTLGCALREELDKGKTVQMGQCDKPVTVC